MKRGEIQEYIAIFPLQLLSLVCNRQQQQQPQKELPGDRRTGYDNHKEGETCIQHAFIYKLQSFLIHGKMAAQLSSNI